MTEQNRFVKIRDYRKSYGWKLWKRIRPSKSKREFRNYSYLRKIGVPCPGDLEYEDRRNIFGILTFSSITMEKLEDTTDIRYLMCLDEYAELRANEVFRKKLSRKISGYVRTMHDNDFFHLNLNFRNVLVSREATDEPKVYIIDVTSSVIQPMAVRRHYMMVKEIAFLYKDARKWCTLRELMIFFHTYLGKSKLNQADRELMQEIKTYAEGKWGDRSSTVDD